MATGQKNTYGPRRRFKGKRGRQVKVRGGYIVVMRSHTHGGGSPSRDGYECGQKEAYPSRSLPGKFRVQMPKNRIRYIKPGGC